MRVDHCFGAKPPSKKDPLFFHVKVGMTVVVSEGESWWMGDVIYKEGGARDPKVPTLFQIACVDTGVIRWVNAYLVTHVVPAT